MEGSRNLSMAMKRDHFGKIAFKGGSAKCYYLKPKILRKFPEFPENFTD